METAGACYAMLLGDKLNLVGASLRHTSYLTLSVFSKRTRQATGCAVLGVKEQEPNTHFLLRS